MYFHTLIYITWNDYKLSSHNYFLITGNSFLHKLLIVVTYLSTVSPADIDPKCFAPGVWVCYTGLAWILEPVSWNLGQKTENQAFWVKCDTVNLISLFLSSFDSLILYCIHKNWQKQLFNKSRPYLTSSDEVNHSVKWFTGYWTFYHCFSWYCACNTHGPGLNILITS